jgi:hypothetical protein
MVQSIRSLMSFTTRFRDFWRSRLDPSYIEPREAITTLSTQASFPVNDALEARIRAARGVLPPKPEVKRKLIQENPDTWKQPIKWDDWDGPV